jgi:type IV pilus assembly protein PilA
MTTTTFQQQLKKRVNKKRKNGFTLVELLIVVVILGILSGVALPNFLKQRDKAKVASANAAAAALMTACEVGMTNDEDLTADVDVTRLADALPDDTEALVTETITADNCSATVTGTAVKTEGSFTAFGAKTAAIAGEPETTP